MSIGLQITKFITVIIINVINALTAGSGYTAFQYTQRESMNEVNEHSRKIGKECSTVRCVTIQNA
jgi:hypothetical protein